MRAQSCLRSTNLLMHVQQSGQGCIPAHVHQLTYAQLDGLGHCWSPDGAHVICTHLEHEPGDRQCS